MTTPSDNLPQFTTREKFNQLKNKKKNFNMFIPGFLSGIFLHRASKKYITLEHVNARPWAGIITGIILGSFLHYWTWKKRLIIEDMCITEELNERKYLERHFRKLKAGDDIENAIILNYLKNNDSI